MTNDTLSSLMRINHHKEGITKWDPEPAIECWLTSAKTKRRVESQNIQGSQHPLAGANVPLLPQLLLE